MRQPKISLFSRFLSSLGVRHTRSYSDRRFRSMTFNSLFGLSHLLKDYGVPSEGWRLSNPSELSKITPPFLAQNRDGVMLIVNEFDPKNDSVTFDDRGSVRHSSVAEFSADFNGVVLLAFPDASSREPDYVSHRVTELVRRASTYVLAVLAVAVSLYFSVVHGIWSHPSAILILVFDCLGLWLSYMLLQKSLGIHTATSEKVCGVLEKGGCDAIATSKASKLFGVFSWSEVGFGYFGISLVVLLLYPHLWPYLGVCNICCLPYTVWSISYQKFKARHWCTLCVGVQLTLWALFLCYLGGGWLGKALPLRIDLFVLMAVYIIAVLALNALLRICRESSAHADQ